MEAELPRLIYLLVLGLAVVGWMFTEFRHSLGKTLRSAVAWILIFMGVIAAYGLWEDIRQDVSPRQTVIQDGSAIEVPKGPDGHFHLRLVVNDVPVWFLVDTGASDLVLTMEDAERVGLDPDQLAFIGRAETANGTVRTAPARLDRVEIGTFEFQNIPIAVNGGEMRTSLLGMEFLQLFDRLEIERDRLRLVP